MDVMKQAVQVAKGYEGDWQARMKMALRNVWNAVNAGQEAMDNMKNESIIDRRAAEQYQTAVDSGVTNPDMASIKQEAKQEYNTLFITLEKIQSIAGADKVDVEKAAEQVEQGTMDQYVAFIREAKNILKQLKK